MIFLLQRLKEVGWGRKIEIEGINGRQIQSYLREQKSLQGIKFSENLQLPTYK